jgi:hypothetical protein
MEKQARIGFDGVLHGGPGLRQKLSLAESILKVHRLGASELGML